MPSRNTWRMRLLRAGSFRLDGGGMFGILPKTLWSRWVEADGDNRIGLDTNCLLLEDGSRRVLVEAGFGDKWGERERGHFRFEPRTVATALGEIGVAPDEIDAVVVTHLHFDHAAGLTRHTGPDATGPVVATFPRAEILVQRQEWEDALANRSTMTRTYLPTTMEPLRDRVRLLDGACEPLPGIRVEPMPGHTWGMQAIRFRDAEGEVCFPGDLLPTRHHAHLSASLAYDMLPYESMLAKRRFLAQAAAEGTRIVLDHEPGPPVFTVRPDPDEPDRWRLDPTAAGMTAG